MLIDILMEVAISSLKYWFNCPTFNGGEIDINRLYRVQKYTNKRLITHYDWCSFFLKPQKPDSRTHSTIPYNHYDADVPWPSLRVENGRRIAMPKAAWINEVDRYELFPKSIPVFLQVYPFRKHPWNISSLWCLGVRQFLISYLSH